LPVGITRAVFRKLRARFRSVNNWKKMAGPKKPVVTMVTEEHVIGQSIIG
jgi:hypothetical protein